MRAGIYSYVHVYKHVSVVRACRGPFACSRVFECVSPCACMSALVYILRARFRQKPLFLRDEYVKKVRRTGSPSFCRDGPEDRKSFFCRCAKYGLMDSAKSLLMGVLYSAFNIVAVVIVTNCTCNARAILQTTVD